MKKILLITACCAGLWSCNNQPASVDASNTNSDTGLTLLTYGSTIDVPKADSIQASSDDPNFMPYNTIIVEKGTDFVALKKTAEAVAVLLNIPFDMKEKVYKPGKGIIVPEDSEDDMYAGEYYPRRPFYEDPFVSIEMASSYDTSLAYTDTTMVIIAAVIESSNEADSILKLVKPKFGKAYNKKQDYYMGCMH